MDSQRRVSPTTDLLAPGCCPRWQTSTSSIWGCARLPRPLGRQNTPLYKLSAGVFGASEENLAAKIHQQPTSSPRGVFRVGRLPPPRFGGALACLGPLVDKTPPCTSSPQVSSGPLRKTSPRRVTNNRPPRPEVFSALTTSTSFGSLFWGCARLPRRLGRQNAPLYKISAGFFAVSEENLTAENPTCIVLVVCS